MPTTLRKPSSIKTSLVLGSAALLAATADAQVLPPDTILGNRTVGEWTEQCWKWVWSIPTNENPQVDCEGRWANNRQPDATIFFVPPVNGNVPPPCVRTFTVPEGKYILLPVLGITIDNLGTIPPLTVEEMYLTLNAVLDTPAALHATIDGVPVPNLVQYRATSPPFSHDFLTTDNSLGFFYGLELLGLVDPIIVDGYWLLLNPLPVGSHVLRAGGEPAVPIFFPHDLICNITV